MDWLYSSALTLKELVNSVSLRVSPCTDCSSIFTKPSTPYLLRHNNEYDEYDYEGQDEHRASLDGCVTHRRRRDSMQVSATGGCELCRAFLRLYEKCIEAAKPEVGHKVRLSSKPSKEQDFNEELVFCIRRHRVYDSVLEVAVHGLPWDIMLLEICADSGDPAARFIPGRPTNLEVGSEASFQAARRWLQRCDKRHNLCPSLRNSKLPTRVIDVFSSNEFIDSVRLYSGQGRCGRYVALSYCWGGPQPVTTTWETLSQNFDGIPLSSLPASLRDAVICTRKLGLRYLWIDALCIVQDSAEDRTREIAKMAEVYSNAYVTIQAASASSCRDGFLEARKPRHVYTTLPFRCDKKTIGRVLVSEGQDIMVPREGIAEPINSRGWTLQERALSPRTLIFSQLQLFWKCPGQFKTDGGQIRWIDYSVSTGFNVEEPESDPRLKKNRKHTFPDAALSEDQLYVEWHNIAGNYTERNITNPSDKLPALSAIASSFHTALKNVGQENNTYIAGCWAANIEHDLAWSCPRGASRPAHWRAPSWSWMSVDGLVVFAEKEQNYKGPGIRLAPHVETLEHDLTLESPIAPFGSITAAKMRIRGHMAPARVKPPAVYLLDGDDNSRLYRSTGVGGKPVGTVYVDDPSDWEPGRRADAGQPGHWIFVLATSWEGFTMMEPESGVEIVWGLVLVRNEGGEYRRVGLFKSRLPESERYYGDVRNEHLIHEFVRGEPSVITII